MVEMEAGVINLLENARELVRNYSITPQLRQFGLAEIGSYGKESARALYFNGKATMFLTQELNSEILARSLHYFIELDCQRVQDGEKVPLGISKIKGLPHLPALFQWPEGYLFYAQLNLADLARFDIEKLLPAAGMIYIFFNPDENAKEECKVIYYEGDVSSLAQRPYPFTTEDFPEAQDYWNDFVNESYTINFIPHFIFYMGEDAYDYEAITQLVPKDLLESIAGILQCSVTDSDVDTRIYGRPIYWQGEDECDNEEKMEKAIASENVLLFQDEFAEGHIHLWITRNDLRKKDFSSCFLTYSGI